MVDLVPQKRKFRGTSVTLYVGDSQVLFVVPEEVLCEASTVFGKAFRSNLKEGSEKTMTLPEEDADMFEILIGCIYTDSFDAKIFGTLRDECMDELLWPVARLYVLADKYGVEKVKIQICEGLFVIAKEYNEDMCLDVPGTDLIEYVYNNTGRSDIIRQVLADWFARGYPWNQPRDHGSEEIDPLMRWLRMFPEFAVDLAIIERDDLAEMTRSLFTNMKLKDYMALIQQRALL